MRVTVSAPGKTILIGEHAAVYGRPALVASVDRRLHAELRWTGGDEVRLELPAVAVTETVPWPAIRAYTRRSRRLWQDYETRPEPQAFERLRGEDPAHLIKIALGEAAELLAGDAPGVALRLRSDIPIGAGFGSSAAAAVAVVQAFLTGCGVELSVSELERLGLEVERRQHGLPSGIDSTTVIRGGLIWALRNASGRLAAQPVRLRSAALDRIRVFNSGTPAESTGAVVAAVRERRDRDRESFAELLDRMTAATREMRRQLESESESPQCLVEPMRDFEACLEEAGVVPPDLRAVVRAVEAQGGAAKISGAGALTGRGAGSLLVYHPEPAAIERWSFLGGLEPLDLRLGAEGVRLEEAVR